MDILGKLINITQFMHEDLSSNYFDMFVINHIKKYFRLF